MDLLEFVTTTSVGFIAAAAAIVLASVGVIRKVFEDRPRLYIVSAVVIGSVLGLLFGPFTPNSYNVLAGFLAGLTAAGTYSGVKTVKNG